MKALAAALALAAVPSAFARVPLARPVSAARTTAAPQIRTGLPALPFSVVPTVGRAPALSAAPSVLASLAAFSAPADEPKAPGAAEPAGEKAAQAGTPESAGAKAKELFDGGAARAAMKEDAVAAPPAADAVPRFGLRRVLSYIFSSRRADKPQDRPGKGVDEEDQADELGLFYAGTSARGLLDSHIWGDVKLIKPTAGSKWWWKKFKKGETIRVKAGSEWLFHTRLTDARTKPIGKLTKADLEGIFSAADLSRHGIGELRTAVVERLTKAHKDQFPVNLRTDVRLLHFKTPKQLNDDSREGKPAADIYDPFAARAALKLPADSPLRRLNQFYPKAVMVDLDVFGERISPQLIEDMGKLQRAGVKFVFFSDRPGAQYKVQQAQILDGLYGSLFVHDGGARIVSHSRGVEHTRTADLLTEYDRGILLSHAQHVAYELGIDVHGVSEVPVAQPGGMKGPARSYFNGRLPADADAEAFKAALEARLNLDGSRREVVLAPAGKGAARGFIVRHRRVTDSMGDVLRGLQDMGVYANPQEILVISEDPRYAASLEAATRRLLDQDQPGADGKAAARAGAVRPAPDAATLAGVPLQGQELVENALGAVLGEYRQNIKGDFVTSASALDSFAHYTDRYFSQELVKGEENVYAFWGHQTHDVMNWVGWVQRNTGRAPTEEEVVARFRRQWDEATLSAEFAVYLPPGRDFVNLREAGVGRLKGIYQIYRRIMDVPGAHFIGTEVPNVFSLRSLDRKAGETRRVFIRTIFDFIALVPAADGKGMALWIMDFKSGVKPTQEILERKIQPRTYRLFTAYKWPNLPEEYDIAAGALAPIHATRLEFLYNRSAVTVPLNSWHDGMTELEILRLAERMRQDKQRTHLRPKRKTRPAAKK